MQECKARAHAESDNCVKPEEHVKVKDRHCDRSEHGGVEHAHVHKVIVVYRPGCEALAYVVASVCRKVALVSAGTWDVSLAKPLFDACARHIEHMQLVVCARELEEGGVDG